MNASATLRLSYIRQVRMSLTFPISTLHNAPISTPEVEPRPARTGKLKDFQSVLHIPFREKCENDRGICNVAYDVERDFNSNNIYINNGDCNEGASFMDFDDDSDSAGIRVQKMLTIFPYRDPIWLVAVIFAVGSMDLVINAFFDLLQRTNPETRFETEEVIAIPTTVLIGSVLFFVAGIFDTVGALNADCGSLETSKEDGKITYRPALLGTPEFRWIPSPTKLYNLTMNNLAFQAGLLVLFGGVVFMFAGIVDFPGVIPEHSPLFELVVFGPQVLHGALFFVSNALLAISAQERWYSPHLWNPDWQGALLNAVGGFGFMMAGLFFFVKDDLNAAIAAMVGSWAFLIGSLIRWYLVMEFW